MLAWVLICVAWFLLVLLILHDATKDDSNGSAVLIAAEKLRAPVETMLRPRKAGDLINADPSPLPANVDMMVDTKPAVSIRQATALAIQPTSAKQTKRRRLRDGRVSISTLNLETAITEAIKKTQDCEEFVGVVIRKTTPKTRLDTNWELRGIKFGNADRKKADEALTPIIESMQREFRLSED
jgi:hypothetical protein